MLHFDGLAARIRTVMPDSPALALDSGDDWAVSSLNADLLSDLEDEIPISPSPSVETADTSLVMPRLLLSIDASSGGATALTAPIGKLGVLVAGSSSSGKSQLVDTIISECPAIVDSTGPLTSGDRPEFFQRRAKSLPISHNAISYGDDHFNIAFVETSLLAGNANEIEVVSSFLESRFGQTATLINGLHPTSMQILRHSWSLGQFSHIDVCLYLLEDKITQHDIETLRAISRFAAVVPLIAKSDRLGPAELVARKQAFAKTLKENHIAMFVFDDTPQLEYPMAVSTSYERNYDMTMSEVMSPGYASHILVQSDVQELIKQLFSDNGAQQVREHAAKRFVDWVSARTLNYGARFSNYPVLISPGVKLDMNWPLSCRGEMQLSLADPPKMRPIGNVDPLQLFQWNSKVWRFVMMLAAAAFSLTMFRHAFARFFAAQPLPPPPSPPVTPHRRLGTVLREIMGNFQIVVA